MYGAQVWTPKLISLCALQNYAMRIMTFSEFRTHSEPLFKKLEILKFSDYISLYNCIFVFDYLNGNLPDSFTETFHRIDSIHNTNTRQASTGMLYPPKHNTITFGFKSIYNKCVNSWNKLTSQINEAEKCKLVNKMKTPDIDLLTYSRGKLKNTLTEHILSQYTN